MIDLKSRLNESGVRDLITLSIGSPEKLDQICHNFLQRSNWKIMGYECNGVVVGCIGVEVNSPRSGILRCISVAPSARERGIGRTMVEQIVKTIGVTQLIAETDREAVDFYSRCGFQVQSLGERYRGVERFRCVKDYASPGVFNP